MKVVIDTNVFVSSFLGGKPRQVTNGWLDENFSLCLSADILNEYLRVFDELDMLDKNETQDVIQLLEGQYNLLFTRSSPNLEISDDPTDDKFLECAVELNANHLVTGDSDLLDLGRYGRIDINTPSHFLTLLE